MQNAKIGVVWWVGGTQSLRQCHHLREGIQLPIRLSGEKYASICTVFELQRVISRKSPMLTYPPAFGTPDGGDPIQISPRLLTPEN